MKALKALNILNDLSASQQGVFTAAQARRVGVDKLALSRLEANGQVERMMHGVYRACAAPSFREEMVWAAWLALDPGVFAWERTRDGTQGAASHQTAAWLLRLGELNPEPITFTAPARKQTRREGVRLARGALVQNEITIVKGIPATTPARTVLDLLDDGEDASLVASVFKDASGASGEMLRGEYAAKVDARAKRYGLTKDQSLFERLKGQG